MANRSQGTIGQAHARHLLTRVCTKLCKLINPVLSIWKRLANLCNRIVDHMCLYSFLRFVYNYNPLICSMYIDWILVSFCSRSCKGSSFSPALTSLHFQSTGIHRWSFAPRVTPYHVLPLRPMPTHATPRESGVPNDNIFGCKLNPPNVPVGVCPVSVSVFFALSSIQCLFQIIREAGGFFFGGLWRFPISRQTHCSQGWDIWAAEGLLCGFNTRLIIHSTQSLIFIFWSRFFLMFASFAGWWLAFRRSPSGRLRSPSNFAAANGTTYLRCGMHRWGGSQTFLALLTGSTRLGWWQLWLCVRWSWMWPCWPLAWEPPFEWWMVDVRFCLVLRFAEHPLPTLLLKAKVITALDIMLSAR